MTVDFLALPWWLALALAVFVGYLVLRARRAESVRLPRGVRIGLAGLRLAALAILVGTLAEPALAWTAQRAEPPAVAVVIDRSGSMSLPDPAEAPSAALDEAIALGLVEASGRAEAAARAARLAARLANDAPGEDDAAAVRSSVRDLAGEAALAAALQRLAEALAAGQADAVHAAAVEAAARATRSQAAADAALVGAAGPASPLGRALAHLATLPRRERAWLLAQRLAERMPGAAVDWFVLDEHLVQVADAAGAHAALSGTAGTDLGEGLAQLSRGWAGRGYPAAVVLLTDGRRTAGADPEAAARALAVRGAQLLTVAVGDPEPSPTAAVAALDGPGEVVAGEGVHLVATVRVPSGIGAWELVWRRDGTEVARRLVNAGTAWRRVEADFPAGVAGEAGVALWEARLEPVPTTAPGGATAGAAAVRAVTMSAAAPRLLVVDATPRWELRHAIAALESGLHARVDRCYRAALGPGVTLLPDQAGLDAYDGLILGDLAPSELGSDEQARIAAFVARRGGFLAVVAGPRAMPSAYGLGPLAAALPVRAGAPGEGDASQAMAMPGPAAAALPIAPPDAAPWASLPPLPWWLRGGTARPGVDVLLTADDHGASPLVAAWRHGAGRVVWFGSDQLWRWRAYGDGSVHAALWLRAVRWGLGARMTGGDWHLQAALDRAVAAPDEAVELRVRASGDSGAPAPSPAAWLERVGDAGGTPARRDLVLTPVADQPGSWSAEVGGAPGRPLAPGRWRAIVRDGAGRKEARDLLVRTEPNREMLETALDRPALERLAAAAGGRAAGMDTVSAEMDRLATALQPRLVTVRHRLTLWDGPWWLLAAAALLMAEWIWRRKVGMP